MSVAVAATVEETLEGSIARLHGVIDDVQSTVPQTSSASAAHALADVDRAVRRLQSVRLSLLAASDNSTVAADRGFADTTAWAARTTCTDSASTRADLQLATDLLAPAAGPEEGSAVALASVPPGGPAVSPAPRPGPTAEALGKGEIGPEHAAVIMRALHGLPDRLPSEARRAVEVSLVGKARRVSPGQLRRLARRALAAVEPDETLVDAHEDGALRDEEAAALARTTLTLHDHGDGTTSGHFLVPTPQAGMLRKVLDAITAPRRHRSPGHPESRDLPEPDWKHRRGLAFLELLEHLPTDHLHARGTATVLVMTRLEDLRGGLRAAQLDTGERLSAGATRRLACGAGILPSVLDGVSVPLDLGRERRLFTETKRAALASRHQECAADGCDRPFAWCELHHRDPWSRGGRTDQTNAVPLCAHHHRRVHDPGYLHQRLPDGSLRFTRRT